MFLNGELHTILKPKNLEIGEHLSFCNYWRNCVFFFSKFGFRNLNITKLSLLVIPLTQNYGPIKCGIPVNISKFFPYFVEISNILNYLIHKKISCSFRKYQRTNPAQPNGSLGVKKYSRYFWSYKLMPNLCVSSDFFLLVCQTIVQNLF